MGTRHVAAGVLASLLLVGGCGSMSDDIDARASPRADIGSVTTEPYGDAEIQQVSTLSELPASQVDDVHGSEFNVTTVYASEDRSQLFYAQMIGFCDDEGLGLEAKGDDIRVTTTGGGDEPSDEVCAAGAVTRFVTVTLADPLGDRVLIID